jgi:DNA-binding transcriptional LysR family regulator
VPRLDLNLLPHLRALLEARSVTQAADSVGIGQPAMSASLRKLRTHFGDPLLVRRGRVSQLTPLGVALRPLVEDALVLVNRAADGGSVFDPRWTQRSFRVAGSDYARALLTPGLLSAFAADAPTAHLRMLPVPSGEGDTVRLHLADAVIAPEGYAIAGRHDHLFEDTFVVIADAGHPVLAEDEPRLDTLSSYPQATVDFGVAAPSPSERALDELGVQRRVGLTVPGLLDLPRSIVGTTLIAFVPSLATQVPGFPAQLRVLRFPTDREPSLSEGVFWSTAALADPAHDWLARVIRVASATLRPHVDESWGRLSVS